MEPRMIVAYGLIGLMLLLAAVVVLWVRYHGRDQTIAREQRREREEDQRRLAERKRSEG